MKSILDPSFRYTPSVETDIRKTFRRVARAMRQGNTNPLKVVRAEAEPRDPSLPNVFRRRAA